ncbi:SIS domain-containing protein [Enterococcus hirae]|uniref:SIS domain-containing protein n=1 Tax=Enterococcus hirae TaxID=1354 RepID=UPI000A7A5F66|nr:SIS domain-containing protein [Enterococcus hirae]
MSLRYFDYYQRLEKKLRIEEPLMVQAASLIARQVSLGGRLQIFASRTLNGIAFEFWEHLPEMIPGKLIENPANGIYETLEGTGKAIIDQLSVKQADIFLLLSNEGRDPSIVELAQWIKSNGHLLIIVTGFDLSRSIKSQHSNGLRLFEFADLVLDNHAQMNDTALSLSEVELALCDGSSIATILLLQQTLYFTVCQLIR